MTSSITLENAELIASGASAEIITWGAEKVLKLFFEPIPDFVIANEASATRAAFEAGLPVPEVIEGPINVDQRRGLVLERIDGPTMSEYLKNHPEELESCAHKAAELMAMIHSVEEPGIAPWREIVIQAIGQAVSLDEKTRQAVLSTLSGLSHENALCHGDFYPDNILMSERGPISVDWALGGNMNPLHDYANAGFLLKFWPFTSRQLEEPVLSRSLLRQYHVMFCQRYEELRNVDRQSARKWQMVAAAFSLALLHKDEPDEIRISFIEAVLSGAKHLWI